ncbi:MAG: HlyD family efflux transporter periplasmic adaptor subunit [Marinifilaceae bacterium]
MDKIIKRKSWVNRNKYSAIGAMFVLSIVIYQIAFADHSSKFKVDADKISINEITYDSFQDYISVTGNVEPIKTVMIAAIEGGRIEEIFIEESNFVKKGDVIMKLGNPSLILEISNNEAQVTRSINDLQMTKLNMQTSMMDVRSKALDLELNLVDKTRTYNINNKLYGDKLISRVEFEKSKEDFIACSEKMKIVRERQKNDSAFYSLQIFSLGKSIERMENNLKMVSNRVDNLYVKAPCNGELAQLVPEVGQVISYGAPIGKVNVLDSYKLRLDIDEHYISRINKTIQAQCLFSGKQYAGKIKKIYTEVDKGKFHVDLIFIDKVPKDIRIGQTSRIKLELGKPEKSILLPRGAFYQKTGGRWVYVLDKSGAFATKRSIEIGRYNPRYYEVLSGLDTGEKVITSSYEIFGDSDKIILK